MLSGTSLSLCSLSPSLNCQSNGWGAHRGVSALGHLAQARFLLRAPLWPPLPLRCRMVGSRGRISLQMLELSEGGKGQTPEEWLTAQRRVAATVCFVVRMCTLLTVWVYVCVRQSVCASRPSHEGTVGVRPEPISCSGPQNPFCRGCGSVLAVQAGQGGRERVGLIGRSTLLRSVLLLVSGFSGDRGTAVFTNVAPCRTAGC